MDFIGSPCSIHLKRAVRPEPFEGQVRMFPNEAFAHHERRRYMLRFFDVAQNQHERILRKMPLINEWN